MLGGDSNRLSRSTVDSICPYNKTMVNPSLHTPYNQTNRIVDVCPQPIISESHSKTRKYKCKHCPYISNEKTKCLRHMRTHTGEKPYECEVCNRSFSRNDCLKIHMITHSGEKPYECKVCNKSFSRNFYLKIHMRTHTGEKPYKCEVCNRSFSQHGHLKLHMRSHTGEKELVCNECFTLESKSISHIKHVHLKTMPYKCNNCEKQFVGNNILLKHRKTQHKSHEISCTPNEKNILQIDNLKTSVEEHKGNLPPSKQSNQNMCSIGAQKSISCTTHSPYSTQEVSNAVFQNAHLDNSITQHHQLKSDDIDDDCKLLGNLQILTDTSSADNSRNQAQYLSSSGPCLAELPNPTSEWDHSLENISNFSISRHIDESSFSPSLFSSEVSNDIRTANSMSDSENKYQTSVLESNIGPFYSMSPNPESNNLAIDISELFIKAFDSLGSHASQIQQQSAKLSPEKKEYINL